MTKRDENVIIYLVSNRKFGKVMITLNDTLIKQELYDFYLHGDVERSKAFAEKCFSILDGKADADYATCVDLCTKASLREMILPTVVAVAVPIIVGIILLAVGTWFTYWFGKKTEGME